MLDPDCIFCKIIKKEIQAEIIYEDEKTLAFKDINPKAPVHVLVIPKKHIEGVSCLQKDDFDYLTAIWETINKIVEKLNIKEKGFRIIVNSGKDAGQEVFHLHFHVLGGKELPFLVL